MRREPTWFSSTQMWRICFRIQNPSTMPCARWCALPTSNARREDTPRRKTIRESKAGPMAEAGTQLVKQLLDGAGGFKECRSLPARVQRVALGERDHLLDQRPHGFGLGHGGDDALLFNHAGHQAFEKGPARADVALEFITGFLVSHGCVCRAAIQRPDSPRLLLRLRRRQRCGIHSPEAVCRSWRARRWA